VTLKDIDLFCRGPFERHAWMGIKGDEIDFAGDALKKLHQLFGFLFSHIFVFYEDVFKSDLGVTRLLIMLNSLFEFSKRITFVDRHERVAQIISTSM
jgi:hypothetical protein